MCSLFTFYPQYVRIYPHYYPKCEGGIYMAHLENMGPKKWRITIEVGIDPKSRRRRRKYKTVNGTKAKAPTSNGRIN